jgi:uncharacterized protein with PQ loop repeat
MEFNLESFASIVSIFGTCCGLVSKVPQVYKTYKTKSVNDLSENTMRLNITANSCFLFYTLVHKQYPIMMNCLAVITLEGSLLYMKKTFWSNEKIFISNESSGNGFKLR